MHLLTNQKNTVLYTGVTNDLSRRLCEHASGSVPGFTQKYKVHKLVYFEAFDDPIHAIRREKSIKNLVRRKKDELINHTNPQWNSLELEQIDPIASLQDDGDRN